MEIGDIKASSIVLYVTVHHATPCDGLLGVKGIHGTTGTNSENKTVFSN